MWYKTDENNAVTEISYATENTADGWIETQGKAAIGYTVEQDGAFTPPPPPPVTQDDLKADLANCRWEVETGGVDVTLSTGETVTVHTDRDAQATLHATLYSIETGRRTDGATWKFKNGVVSPVSNSDMTAIVLASMQHVQACFEAEARVTDQIENGALSTQAELKPAFDLALQAVKALPA